MHCPSYPLIKSLPSRMHHPEPPPPEDPGQGEGCEGAKCQIPEKK